MTETAIKANEREALRLYERGVAAARGGQRRVAAGLLARAVQLNPRHEASWLWLSGTLEDPNEIAFCLRSVLEINPANERAKQGLLWLEQRRRQGAPNGSANGGHAGQSGAAQAAQPLAPSAPTGSVAPAEGEAGWLKRAASRVQVGRPLDAHAVIEQELHARAHGESWWVNFRRTRRDMGRARLFLWTVPLLLLTLTLGLNVLLRSAVQRNEAMARAAATASVVPTAVADRPPGHSVEVVLSELPPTDDARALAYLSAIDAPRGRLRTAVDEYRAATSRPGGSSTTHAAAARRLRDEVEQAYTAIEAVKPPAVLAQAHAYYLSGLETELAALDDMLAFYGSFSVEIANRATIRMSEADRYLERARKSFDDRRAAIPAAGVAQSTLR